MPINPALQPSPPVVPKAAAGINRGATIMVRQPAPPAPAPAPPPPVPNMRGPTPTPPKPGGGGLGGAPFAPAPPKAARAMPAMFARGGPVHGEVSQFMKTPDLFRGPSVDPNTFGKGRSKGDEDQASGHPNPKPHGKNCKCPQCKD